MVKTALAKIGLAIVSNISTRLNKNKKWTLSDEGQARYNEIIGDL